MIPNELKGKLEQQQQKLSEQDQSSAANGRLSQMIDMRLSQMIDMRLAQIINYILLIRQAERILIQQKEAQTKAQEHNDDGTVAEQLMPHYIALTHALVKFDKSELSSLFSLKMMNTLNERVLSQPLNELADHRKLVSRFQQLHSFHTVLPNMVKRLIAVGRATGQDELTNANAVRLREISRELSAPDLMCNVNDELKRKLPSLLEASYQFSRDLILRSTTPSQLLEQFQGERDSILPVIDTLIYRYQQLLQGITPEGQEPVNSDELFSHIQRLEHTKARLHQQYQTAKQTQLRVRSHTILMGYVRDMLAVQERQVTGFHKNKLMSDKQAQLYQYCEQYEARTLPAYRQVAQANLGAEDAIDTIITEARRRIIFALYGCDIVEEAEIKLNETLSIKAKVAPYIGSADGDPKLHTLSEMKYCNQLLQVALDNCQQTSKQVVEWLVSHGDSDRSIFFPEHQQAIAEARKLHGKLCELERELKPVREQVDTRVIQAQRQEDEYNDLIQISDCLENDKHKLSMYLGEFVRHLNDGEFKDGQFKINSAEDLIALKEYYDSSLKELEKRRAIILEQTQSALAEFDFAQWGVDEDRDDTVKTIKRRLTEQDQILTEMDADLLNYKQTVTNIAALVEYFVFYDKWVNLPLTPAMLSNKYSPNFEAELASFTQHQITEEFRACARKLIPHDKHDMFERISVADLPNSQDVLVNNLVKEVEKTFAERKQEMLSRPVPRKAGRKVAAGGGLYQHAHQSYGGQQLAPHPQSSETSSETSPLTSTPPSPKKPAEGRNPSHQHPHQAAQRGASPTQQGAQSVVSPIQLREALEAVFAEQQRRAQVQAQQQDAELDQIPPEAFPPSLASSASASPQPSPYRPRQSPTRGHSSTRQAHQPSQPHQSASKPAAMSAHPVPPFQEDDSALFARTGVMQDGRAQAFLPNDNVIFNLFPADRAFDPRNLHATTYAELRQSGRGLQNAGVSALCGYYRFYEQEDFSYIPNNENGLRQEDIRAPWYQPGTELLCATRDSYIQRFLEGWNVYTPESESPVVLAHALAFLRVLTKGLYLTHHIRIKNTYPEDYFAGLDMLAIERQEEQAWKTIFTHPSYRARLLPFIKAVHQNHGVTIPLHEYIEMVKVPLKQRPLDVYPANYSPWRSSVVMSPLPQRSNAFAAYAHAAAGEPRPYQPQTPLSVY